MRPPGLIPLILQRLSNYNYRAISSANAGVSLERSLAATITGATAVAVCRAAGHPAAHRGVAAAAAGETEILPTVRCPGNEAAGNTAAAAAAPAAAAAAPAAAAAAAGERNCHYTPAGAGEAEGNQHQEEGSGRPDTAAAAAAGTDSQATADTIPSAAAAIVSAVAVIAAAAGSARPAHRDGDPSWSPSGTCLRRRPWQAPLLSVRAEMRPRTKQT